MCSLVLPLLVPPAMLYINHFAMYNPHVILIQFRREGNTVKFFFF